MWWGHDKTNMKHQLKRLQIFRQVGVAGILSILDYAVYVCNAGLFHSSFKNVLYGGCVTLYQ